MFTPFQFGNIHTDGDFVTGIEEKPNIRTNILAGIYIFKPGILDLIPDDEYFGMDSLIKKMIEQKLTIVHYPIKEYWLDIGQVKDYEMAQEVYKERFQ
jgi:NDP-sugar pyrophosphorylase family protein